jgi:hypothetical protein
MTIWRRVACWISKATHAHVYIYTHARTHTQKYVILIAFPQQQWLRERASVLRYTYIACLVKIHKLNLIAVCTIAHLKNSLAWHPIFKMHCTATSYNLIQAFLNTVPLSSISLFIYIIFVCTLWKYADFTDPTWSCGTNTLSHIAWTSLCVQLFLSLFCEGHLLWKVLPLCKYLVSPNGMVNIYNRASRNSRSAQADEIKNAGTWVTSVSLDSTNC